ncbi:hypothetical protein GHYDROH2_29880 [Geobacter hydrogenophilus]|uniref:Uncharacterized protein n=1 Tax=Geobacter hydrogenophilus TaxID=40983 RepID=A0A9W6G316_9BACT|nr:hypothetical protein GHYDROH2_29880 [Geobacter hydrogenophilus]
MVHFSFPLLGHYCITSDKPIEVKKLRGNIDTEILLTEIPQLIDKHERIAVEIVKLAEKRHQELLK